MNRYGNGIGQAGTLHAGNARWDSFINPTALGQNFDTGINQVIFPCPMLENENIPPMFHKEPTAQTYGNSGTYNELKGPAPSTPYSRPEQTLPATKRALMQTRGPTTTRPSVVNPSYSATPALNSIHVAAHQLNQAQPILDTQIAETGNPILNVTDANGTILTQINEKPTTQNLSELSRAIRPNHNYSETVDTDTGLHDRGVVATPVGTGGNMAFTGAQNEKNAKQIPPPQPPMNPGGNTFFEKNLRPEIQTAVRTGAQTQGIVRSSEVKKEENIDAIDSPAASINVSTPNGLGRPFLEEIKTLKPRVKKPVVSNPTEASLSINKNFAAVGKKTTPKREGELYRKGAHGREGLMETLRKHFNSKSYENEPRGSSNSSPADAEMTDAEWNDTSPHHVPTISTPSVSNTRVHPVNPLMDLVEDNAPDHYVPLRGRPQEMRDILDEKLSSIRRSNSASSMSMDSWSANSSRRSSTSSRRSSRKSDQNVPE